GVQRCGLTAYGSARDRHERFDPTARRRPTGCRSPWRAAASSPCVGFELARASREERRERVARVLDLVNLTDAADRYPYELSGGQQQRVAVARARALAPTLILLDEPFSNLDADLRAQMRDEVEKILRATGTTAILVTHDQEEAFVFADQVGVLQEGRPA